VKKESVNIVAPSEQPVVTIALPVYNGAATLKLAVDSILNQSFPNWEMIILDDASRDDSRKVMRSFVDPRIRLVEGEENIGLSARLNMAMDMAKGIYFARMDQDDVSVKQRIEKQFNYLRVHPEVALLATNYAIFDDKFEWLGKLSVHQHHDDICRKPWNGFYMPHPTWMGKLEWFKFHRYESHADGAEDQNLLLRSYNSSRFACLDEVLLACRQNSTPIKKMLRTRRIFASAYMRHFSAEGRYSMVIKVAVFLLLKVAADVLNLVFGVAGMRNSLRPLSAAEQSAWQRIWNGFEAVGSGKPDAQD